jgi:putative sterol carrier protein
VPEFLSDEWFGALDTAAQSVHLRHEVAPFVFEQVVTSTGEADVRYQIVFADRAVRVIKGAPRTADVSFVADLRTAGAIARGETNAQRALAAGRFRVGGSIEALVRRADALTALDDVFAAVRDITTYR